MIVTRTKTVVVVAVGALVFALVVSFSFVLGVVYGPAVEPEVLYLEALRQVRLEFDPDYQEVADLRVYVQSDIPVSDRVREALVGKAPGIGVELRWPEDINSIEFDAAERIVDGGVLVTFRRFDDGLVLKHIELNVHVGTLNAHGEVM